MPDDIHPYDAACKRAASNQGLDPPAAVLTAAGIEHELYQSGGFCMILTVDGGNGFQIWITDDGETHGEQHLLVTRRDMLDDDEFGAWPPDPTHEEIVPLSKLAEHVRYLREAP